MTEPLLDGPADAPIRLILAHGAGQDADSPFLSTLATALAEDGLRVERFRFPYMQRMLETGGRRPPDREPVLIDAWRNAIAESLSRRGRCERLVIGGKSLGGRIASMIADDSPAAALVCLGYPFHPPGRPEQLRVAHLAGLATPTLICQGTRDPFGSRDELPRWPLSPAIRVAWIEDGEHSFKPRARSGYSWEGNLAQAAAQTLGFIRGLA